MTPTGPLEGMRRTDLLDKDDWIHAQVTKRLRAMTPSRRFQLAVELSEAGRRIHDAAMDRLSKKRTRRSD